MQETGNLIDPRVTRYQRLQTVTGTFGMGILFARGDEEIVPSRKEPTFFDYSLSVPPTEIMSVHPVGN